MKNITANLVVRSTDSNGDQRTLRGIATTPTVDRVGDIIDPLGAKFASKIPLLWQHDHSQPVGWVWLDKPTKAGIGFTATITKIAERGRLQERLDDAWQAVKSGLIGSVSIGFRPLDGDFDRLPSGGLKFNKVEILEVSLVSVAAQADAQILEARGLKGRTDADRRRALDRILANGGGHKVKLTAPDIARGKILHAAAQRKAARPKDPRGVPITPEAKARRAREDQARAELEARQWRWRNGQ